jgi:dUTP pyrophosphatase
MNTPIRLAARRLTPDATLPTQATPGDAGYDLSSAEDSIVFPQNRQLIGTGIAVAIPAGHVGYIKPRSGLAHKHGIDVLGGVIDAGYRGEVKVILHNTSGTSTFRVSPGDRIAQLVVQSVAALDVTEVEDFTEATIRGTGGFGSTGIITAAAL